MDPKYYLSPTQVFDLLKEKGINYLYHANTLATSLTFIEQGAILSRQFVETNNLFQTSQKSDKEDKKYNVWNDIFLDAIDIHKKYRTANKYGPILFVIDLEFLKNSSVQNVLVTKSNPLYWNDKGTWDSRYYDSIEEIKADYLTGKSLDTQIMFTFRAPDKILNLNSYIVLIGIDRPNVIVKPKDENEINVGDHALNKVKQALDKKGLSIPLAFRHSEDTRYCSCYIEYKFLSENNFSEFKKRFAKRD